MIGPITSSFRHLDSEGVEAGVPGPGSYDADKVYGLGACKIRHLGDEHRNPGEVGHQNDQNESMNYQNRWFGQLQMEV